MTEPEPTSNNLLLNAYDLNHSALLSLLKEPIFINIMMPTGLLSL